MAQSLNIIENSVPIATTRYNPTAYTVHTMQPKAENADFVDHILHPVFYALLPKLP